MEQWDWRILRTGKRGEYRMVERRWVVDYMVRKCRDAIERVTHKRLGPTPETVPSAGLPESARRVYLPYVDLVCVFPDRIELIEFKVHDPLKAIAQLQYYRVLASQDPDLTRYRGLPIIAKLVYWRYDAGIEAMCRANGIAYEVECPQFLIDILRHYGYKAEDCIKFMVK
ncbi:MAG: hypothetical protein QXK11_11470 [Pyrobaculum sp.]|uniref:hypothetical protein n=1 Tax=Pyrobaculum sp. TaxID=2004705 RepID=UPI0031763542